MPMSGQNRQAGGWQLFLEKELGREETDALSLPAPISPAAGALILERETRPTAPFGRKRVPPSEANSDSLAR